MKKVKLVVDDSSLNNLNKINKEGTWLKVTNETTYFKIYSISICIDPSFYFANLNIEFVNQNCESKYDKIYALDSLSIEPQLEYSCFSYKKKIMMKIKLDEEISEQIIKSKNNNYRSKESDEYKIALFENYIKTNNKMSKENYENYNKDVLQARCDIDYNITFSKKEDYYNKLINEI